MGRRDTEVGQVARVGRKEWRREVAEAGCPERLLHTGCRRELGARACWKHEVTDILGAQRAGR